MTETPNKTKEKEIDALSGVETTGHEWDGLKELNNPMPRWWVWVFLVTIVWSIWYFVFYPAWPVPGGATQGRLGYTQFKELATSQAEITARQAQYLDEFTKADFAHILQDQGLYDFAIAGGAAAFKDNCATCHGTGAAGSPGYPNLNDDDWLWGGTLEEIYTTLRFGIRSGHPDTHASQMPAFGKDGLLTRDQIAVLADYVIALRTTPDPATLPGHDLFQQNCASCHGADGRGGRNFGAPNLADAIWLYGGDRSTVIASIHNARAGVMPAWETRLDPETLRQLSVYVHQLGGGEAVAPVQPNVTDHAE